MHARIFGILMENHKDFYSKIDFTSHNISKRDFYGLLKFAIFFFIFLCCYFVCLYIDPY